VTIVPARRNRTNAAATSSKDSSKEEWLAELRKKRDLQVTGKLKPPLNRNLPRLRQILEEEGFRIRGDRVVVERKEATFEVDLRMGHVFALRANRPPTILCVTIESSPWTNGDDLSDFDLFLLSVVYLLAHEQLPRSITEQLEQVRSSSSDTS
jgi:hypothetical protein